jgi:sugar transferase (PEP-CTERM/EpsH1 system associated)
MKLLVVLPRFPYPLEKGDKLRAYNHIRFLSEENDIVLCAVNEGEVPAADLEKLKPFCKSIHVFRISKVSIAVNLIRAFFKGIPFQAGYFYNPKIQKQINTIIEKEKPDHIFCQLLRAAEYVKNANIPKTIDYQDVFSKGIQRRISKVAFYLRPVFKMEYHRLLRYEHDLFNIFDNKTIISIPDRDLIPHPDKEKIHIVPNGVDHEFFEPMTMEKKYEIVFIGNMNYPPNVDAAVFLSQKILPEVHKTHPEAKLLLAGASPAKKVLDQKSDFVHVSGWVDDIRECYAQAKIFIAPMQIGTGLQNKLLEAMSMKIPSLTSSLANNALCARENVEILIGETPEEYARHIHKLLVDNTFANSIAEAGYQFVHNKFDWEKATHELSEIMKHTSTETSSK